MPRSEASKDDPSKPRRNVACLHCRRQKLKCDGGPDKTCSRCIEDGVECIIRPRANAAIVADDLRWQQSVERRIQSMLHELAEVKAANRELSSRLDRSSVSSLAPQGPSSQLGDAHLSGGAQHPGQAMFDATSSPDTEARPTPSGAQMVHAASAGGLARPPRAPLPSHLAQLREILRPVFVEIQTPTAVDVSLDDATMLWEFFYDSMAIFHGFTATSNPDTPSPLLFSAVVTASAGRFPTHLPSRVGQWEELFKRALVRLLYVTVPKTWDDVVGLGIARTWFWKADEITAGLIYGSFVETSTTSTTTPTAATTRATEEPSTTGTTLPMQPHNWRDRRVWDFLTMTSISHGLLHLSTPIVPERPPGSVPDRPQSHVLLRALNELFDSLGVVHRSLTSAAGLVQAVLNKRQAPTSLTYAEVLVLRNCRVQLERWCPLWVGEVSRTDISGLPPGSSHDFLIDLITLYYHVSIFLIDGYLNQAFKMTHPDGQRGKYTAAELLNLVVGRWTQSLHLWPKLFLNSALLAALFLEPEDPLVRHAHDAFVSISHIMHTSGSQLLHLLAERLKSAPTGHAPVMALPSSFVVDLPMAGGMPYTASDSFWSDLSLDSMLVMSTGGQGSASGSGIGAEAMVGSVAPASAEKHMGPGDGFVPGPEPMMAPPNHSPIQSRPSSSYPPSSHPPPTTYALHAATLPAHPEQPPHTPHPHAAHLPHPLISPEHPAHTQYGHPAGHDPGASGPVWQRVSQWGPGIGTSGERTVQ